MSRPGTAFLADRQRGLTMAELLVAITLGLFVALAAGSLFASGSRAYLAQTQSAEADEGARYAIDMVARAVRQAAWVDWQHADIGALMGNGEPAALAGLDASSVPKGSPGIQNAVASPVNGSDVLAVRFHGAGAAKGDGSVLDCAGFAVPQNQDGWSIFYVAKSAEGEPELRCKYKGTGGWGADAVIAGVDSFQVLYGVDTDEPPDGVPNRYVNATAVNALDAALVLNGASAAEREADLRRRTYWKRVASVQYALLLRGSRSTAAAADGPTYHLFGPAYGQDQSAADPGTRLREDALSAGGLPRERHVYSATVALRGGAR